jgi:hypothetical protein
MGILRIRRILFGRLGGDDTDALLLSPVSREEKPFRVFVYLYYIRVAFPHRLVSYDEGLGKLEKKIHFFLLHAQLLGSEIYMCAWLHTFILFYTT